MALGKISLNQRECILLSVICLAITGVYVHYWQRPHVAKLQQLKTVIETTEAEIVSNTNLLSQLATRMPVSVESKASQDLLEKYRKSNSQLANVITSISTDNPKYPFLLSRISTESQNATDGFTKILYNIELEATFVSIGKFLERLEDSPLLTEVGSIEIARVSSEMKRCHTKIKLLSYSLKEEK